MFFSLSAFRLCLTLSCLPLHIHVQDSITYMYLHEVHHLMNIPSLMHSLQPSQHSPLSSRRGTLLSTAIFFYAATSPVNGYFGGALYSKMGGEGGRGKAGERKRCTVHTYSTELELRDAFALA